MKKLTQTTKSVKLNEVTRNWHLVDMSGKILGRMVPHIVHLLQGKHKSNYVPYLDLGDYVVVINAKNLVLTGKKAESKTYGQYSGYPGGLKIRSFSSVMEKNPATVIKHAVLGMLPKNKTRDARMARLFIYSDNVHPHEDKLVK